MRYGINTLIVILLSLVIILNICGCGKSEQKKPMNFPDALILLPNATNVKYYEIYGSLQLIYKMKADYPAADVIEAISAKLKQDKWEVLKQDFLNPGISSSHVSGWSSYKDARKKPTQTVHQWLGDWENESGDILRYGFTYQYENNEHKDLTNLTVIAIFIPAPLAKQGREIVNEYRKKRSSGNIR